MRGLFEEAWDRGRRRRRWSLAIGIAGAAVAIGVITATQHDDRNAGPRRAPAVAPPAVLALPRAPGMGVACPRAPNSIACDRIGIAVWVSVTPAHPIHLVATIGARSIELHNRTDAAYCASKRHCQAFYTGYMTHAGLLDGALKVHPDQGRYHWYGRHPVTGTLRLRATYPDGKTAQTTRRAPLGAGWG